MSRPTTHSPFLVPVVQLRKRPGARLEVHAAGPIPELEVSHSKVPDASDVSVDVWLDSVLGGVMVTGKVSADWEAECGRCLEPARGRLEVAVRELFADLGGEDAAYRLAEEWLDLEPLAHDACILELPLAPLCRPDCLGLCPGCGVNRNNETCNCTETTDPRWAGLSVLRDAAPNWRE